MYELFQLFNEMVKFEEEIRKQPELDDDTLSRMAFKEYSGERFNRISMSSEWIRDVEMLKKAA